MLDGNGARDRKCLTGHEEQLLALEAAEAAHTSALIFATGVGEPLHNAVSLIRIERCHERLARTTPTMILSAGESTQEMGFFWAGLPFSPIGCENARTRKTEDEKAQTL